jgi:prepilin-type N-terminal cleavage/methylation domain-containing protein/prepilin-type processing-associated H-X9-DG protein
MSIRHHKGFTLVEMLVVIAIIAVLAALLFPAVQAAREMMRKTQCGNNQRELGRAIQSYDAKKGQLPPARSWSGMVGTSYVYSWVPPVLDYFGQQTVRNQMLNAAGDPRANVPRLEILVCPTDPGYFSGIMAPLNYVVNGGRPNATAGALGANHDWSANGVFDDLAGLAGAYQPPTRMSFADIARLDGSSTTIMMSENTNRRGSGSSDWSYGDNEFESCILWQEPPPVGLNTKLPSGTSLDNDYAIPSSYHTNGFNVTFCDGHVKFLSDKIAYHVYARLMTSDGANTRPPGANTPRPSPAYQTNPLTATDY